MNDSVFSHISKDPATLIREIEKLERRFKREDETEMCEECKFKFPISQVVTTYVKTINENDIKLKLCRSCYEWYKKQGFHI